MKFREEMLRLYGVTQRYEGRNLYEQIEEALKGGMTMVQLREKNISEEEFVKEGQKVKEICRKYRVPLIINDNVYVAKKIGADGVHVGISDMSVKEIRKNVDKDFIIGATAKTREQAETAWKEGADYLGVGAVFPSPTKKNAIRITKEQLKEICASVPIPAVAIGGITLHNVEELKECGISGIAVVSSVFGDNNCKKASEEFLERVKGL